MGGNLWVICGKMQALVGASLQNATITRDNPAKCIAKWKSRKRRVYTFLQTHSAISGAPAGFL
jgi:hypothetical protein